MAYANIAAHFFYKSVSVMSVIKKTVCISDEEKTTYHKIFALPRRAAIYRQFNSSLRHWFFGQDVYTFKAYSFVFN